MNEYVDTSSWHHDSSADENYDTRSTGWLSGIMSSSDPTYGPEVRHVAQQIHTQVYLESKFITHEQLDTAGVFVDEYSDRSDYVVSEKDNRRSACRYIHASKKEGILSLPTAQHFSVDPDVIKEAAGIQRLSDLKAREVIEVSGLASVRLDGRVERVNRSSKLDATRLLYASILRRSLDEGHKLWLLNTDERLLYALEILIGKEQIHRLGEETEYMGPATFPVAINPQEVVKAAFADKTDFGVMKQQYLREELPGVSQKHLSKELIKTLKENDIELKKARKRDWPLKHTRALAYAAIVSYSSARAFPVANIEEFHGSVALFWTIDVATAFPYTWGLIELAAARSSARRAAGGAVAAGCFVAPYAYFWAEGQDYPAYVNAVAGGLIGVAATLEVAKMRKDHRIADSLRAVDGRGDT